MVAWTLPLAVALETLAPIAAAEMVRASAVVRERTVARDAKLKAPARVTSEPVPTRAVTVGAEVAVDVDPLRLNKAPRVDAQYA
jgi:hypothetical protein